MSDAIVPDDLKYTETHEWIRLEGGVATVGITDHAQHELGDIIFVELPEVGLDVKQGDTLAAIEAVKTVADLYAPVAGKIVAVNAALSDDAGRINRDAYGEGWILKIEIQGDLPATVLDAAGYRGQI